MGLYIGYYESQIQGREAVNDANYWLYGKAEAVPIQSGQNRVSILRSKGLNEKDPIIYYFWYVIGGKIYTSRYRAKLAIIFNSAFSWQTNAAIVIITGISGPNNGSAGQKRETEFVQTALPVIQKALQPLN